MSGVILVPVDFSDCSADVVRHAATLARQSDVGLVLLHVIELPPSMSEDTLVRPKSKGKPVKALDYVRAEAERHLPSYLALEELKGLEVTTRIRSGIPAERIVEEAESVEASQIVMGTHGRSGFARMMTGSVAETVIRHTERPVTLIRTQHKKSCHALSCAWCNSGTLEAQDRLWNELDS